MVALCGRNYLYDRNYYINLIIIGNEGREKLYKCPEIAQKMAEIIFRPTAPHSYFRLSVIYIRTMDFYDY